MSLKTSFRSANGRKRFINKMEHKWERKYKQHLNHVPADEGFRYYEYLED